MNGPDTPPALPPARSRSPPPAAARRRRRRDPQRRPEPQRQAQRGARVHQRRRACRRALVGREVDPGGRPGCAPRSSSSSRRARPRGGSSRANAQGAEQVGAALLFVNEGDDEVLEDRGLSGQAVRRLAGILARSPGPCQLRSRPQTRLGTAGLGTDVPPLNLASSRSAARCVRSATSLPASSAVAEPRADRYELRGETLRAAGSSAAHASADARGRATVLEPAAVSLCMAHGSTCSSWSTAHERSSCDVWTRRR